MEIEAWAVLGPKGKLHSVDPVYIQAMETFIYRKEKVSKILYPAIGDLFERDYQPRGYRIVRVRIVDPRPAELKGGE